MPLERYCERWSLLDVFERIMDRGIVIDTWAQASLARVDLLTLKARVVVTSIEIRLQSEGTAGLT